MTIFCKKPKVVSGRIRFLTIHLDPVNYSDPNILILRFWIRNTRQFTANKPSSFPARKKKKKCNSLSLIRIRRKLWASACGSGRVHIPKLWKSKWCVKIQTWWQSEQFYGPKRARSRPRQRKLGVSVKTCTYGPTARTHSRLRKKFYGTTARTRPRQRKLGSSVKTWTYGPRARTNGDNGTFSGNVDGWRIAQHTSAHLSATAEMTKN